MENTVSNTDMQETWSPSSKTVVGPDCSGLVILAERGSDPNFVS